MSNPGGVSRSILALGKLSQVATCQQGNKRGESAKQRQCIKWNKNRGFFFSGQLIKTEVEEVSPRGLGAVVFLRVKNLPSQTKSNPIYTQLEWECRGHGIITQHHFSIFPDPYSSSGVGIDNKSQQFWYLPFHHCLLSTVSRLSLRYVNPDFLLSFIFSPNLDPHYKP